MTNSHYNEPIDTSNSLHGNSRTGRDASPEVQQRLIDIIIEEAHKLNFNNRDTAYYIAIAKHESGFNPDAANKGSTASGVGQIEDGAAKTYGLTDKTRFDARSNICAGLRYFAALKAQVLTDFKSASGDYEPLIYFTYHFGQYSTHHRHVDPKRPGNIIIDEPFKIEELKNEHPHKSRYDESANLLKDVTLIEGLLNAAHGLHVQLTDVMGKPMPDRKVIVVKPVPPESAGKAPANTPAATPAKPQSTPTPPAPALVVPQPAVTSAPAQGSVPGNPADQSGKVQADGTTGPATPVSPLQTAATQADQNPSATANTLGTPATTTGDTQAASKDQSTQCAAPAVTNSDGQTESKDGANQCTAPATTADSGDQTEAKGHPNQCLAKGWTWTAVEMTTDGDGKLPEIVTDSHQPFYVLIPRPEYSAYNDAVAKQSICEAGNQHDPAPKDNLPTTTGGTGDVAGKTDATTGDQSQGTQGDTSDKKSGDTTQNASDANLKDPTQPTTPAMPAVAQTASANSQTTPTSPPPPAPAATQAAVPQAPKLAAPAQQTHPAAAKPTPPAQPTATPQRAPAKAPSLTALEVLEVVNKTLSWQNLVLTTFSYIKEFHTRPKLPDKPLDPKTVTEKGPVRTVAINSSLKAKEVKAPEAKATVTTAKKAEEKKVEATGDAPWMTFALEEEAKQIQTQKTPSPRKDPAWQAAHAKREEAKKAKAQATADLKKETSRKKPPPDPAKVGALQAEIAQQEKNSEAADAEMKNIESKCYTTDGYNNDQVVKYLGSVFGENADISRDISTYWCASFTNWCLKKGGYKGTNSGRADSYLNWGEKIDVPKYGAITVVTRSSAPDYHVGFYLGIDTMKKFPRIKLLSGNYSHTVRDGVEWAEDPKNNEALHLVSYHWPTDAEKLP